MNQYQLTTIRGQGIEIDTAINGSAVYWSIRGQSISEDAGVYIGTRDEALAMLLGPLGLKEQGGKVVGGMETFIEALKASEHGMAVPYAHGYTAYVSEDLDNGGYFITYCQGEMPPHSTERVDTTEQAAAKLAEIADLSRAYDITPNE